MSRRSSTANTRGRLNAVQGKTLGADKHGVDGEGGLSCAQVQRIYSQLKTSNFDSNQVSSLEASQLLERYLWPRFPPSPEIPGIDSDTDWGFLGTEVSPGRIYEESEDVSQSAVSQSAVSQSAVSQSAVSVRCDDEQGNVSQVIDSVVRLRIVRSWILLITCLINEKFRQRVDVWTSLGLDSEGDEFQCHKFRLLFYLSWFLFLQSDKFGLIIRESSSFIQFFIHVYQSLEQDKIRRVCMPLCGLPSWRHLGAKQLTRLFNARPELGTLWKVVQKRYKGISKRCGADATFDGSSSIGLLDRLCLLDRDGLKEALSQFIHKIEITFTQSINIKNLRSEETIDEATSLFSTMGAGCIAASTNNDSRNKTPIENKSSTDNGHQRFKESDSDFDSSQMASELRNENPDDISSDEFLYCERFLEFLIDLMSQLPTRRIFHPVLSSYQIIPRLRLSPIFRHSESGLIRQLTDILSGFESFEIDDATGEPLDNKNLEMRHYEQLKELQLVFFEHFQHVPRLKEAALGPIGAYDRPGPLRQLFSELSVTFLLQIADALNLVDALGFARTVLGHLLPPARMEDGPKSQGLPILHHEASSNIEIHHGTDEYKKAHRLMVEVLVNYLQKRPNQLTHINQLPLFPIETLIWDPNMVPTEHYEGDFSLALPKLNLQFLTIRDYLLRNFHLFRLESTYEIREDLEDAVYRMKPILAYSNTDPNSMILSYTQQSILETQFRGTARMACAIDRFAIVLVKSPALGSDVPLEVRAEIVVDLKRVPKEIKREWDHLRQFDVLFLLAIRAPIKVFEGRPQDLSSVAEFPEKFGVFGVRGCEIVEVLDEEGCSISEPTSTGEMLREPFGDLRTYRVLLDPFQYHRDLDEMAQGTSKDDGEERNLDIYSAMNLVVRRKPAENNFKAILQTIRQLMNDTENAVIPSWLHDLFLGYGDPKSAQYFNLPTELQSIDFVDTFLDYNHIKESFPSSIKIELSEKVSIFHSPCRLFFQSVGHKKNSTGLISIDDHQKETISIMPYTIISRGPYPQCEVKTNKIRFTPSQIEAIRSGVNHGLTLIVGPPGTGKTDIAVQIIQLLHKNFPDQRILIVAHSNQALNDLFEKIVALDIDERYLLRLGMGEKELRIASDRALIDSQKKDFSKWGRVNYMLQRRIEFLKKVDFLGQTLRVPGDVGSSCETAIQFYRFHIVSRIQRFRRQLNQVGKEGRGLRVLLRDMRLQDGEQNRTVFPTIAKNREVKKATTQAEKEAAEQPKQKKKMEEEDENEDEDEAMVYQRNGPEEDVEMKMEEVSSKTVTIDEQEEETRILQSFDQIDDDSCIAFKEGRISVIEVLFPFTAFFNDIVGGLFPKNEMRPDYNKDLEIAEGCFRYLSDVFKEIEECRAFELLRTLHDRGNYLLTRHAKVIAMTCTHAALVRQQMVDIRLRYDSLIMEEAAQALEVETFVPMVLQKTESGGVSRLKRVVLIGDHNQLPPVVKNRGFQQYGRLDQSMFTRFIRLQVPFVQLDRQGRCRTSLRELFGWRYSRPCLSDLPIISTATEYSVANMGLTFDYQFINVEDYEGKGEFCPLPYFYQNRGEAEYAVALFMYMRLLGYPAERIVILTTYNGQKALLKEIIQQRCGWNPAIGWPSVVSTVDKFQGQQSDYVILSLVRTRAVGHLRDVRRLIVAVSRARLGLYVFGRMSVFGSCLELEPTFQLFKKRPTKLALNLDEASFHDPSGRAVSSSGPMTFIDDVYSMWEKVQQKALQAISQLHQPPSA